MRVGDRGDTRGCRGSGRLGAREGGSAAGRAGGCLLSTAQGVEEDTHRALAAHLV